MIQKLKKFFKELTCGHVQSPNLYADKTLKPKRHYYVCLKCGKRLYIN